MARRQGGAAAILPPPEVDLGPKVGEVVVYHLPASGAERPAMVLGEAPDGGLMLSVFVTPSEGQAPGSHVGHLEYVQSAKFAERDAGDRLAPGRWTWRTTS